MTSQTAPSRETDAPLRGGWIAFLRLFLAAGAFGVLHFAEAFNLGALTGFTYTVWACVFLAYAIIGAAPLAKRDRTFGATWFALTIGADIGAVTGIVYLTGGPFSPLLFLYLPVVGCVATNRSRGWGLGCAACATGAYGSLAANLTNRSLALADGTFLLTEPPGGVILQTIGLGSGMVLTAVATSFLARRLATTSVIAAASSALADEQRHLLGQIPDGIVKLRLDGTIEYCNEAASTLLGIPSRAILEQSLDQLLRSRGATDKVDLTPAETLRTAEIEIHPAGTTQHQHLTCTLRPIFDRRHALIGTFVLLRDVTTLRSAQEQLEIQERMARLLAAAGANDRAGSPLQGFVGESGVMQRVFNLIERVAHFDATVLISGESGTGKELVAKSIHRRSAVSSGPFVAVNCGAIPENLIESELFGHRRGAFTGADTDALGLFRRADGGTIFLDEIGELPLALQAKLLRVLQEKRVRPVGGESDVPIRVRVIAATNRNLRAEVKSGTFREDLFYRLNVVNIALPPLRERRDDIPPLVDTLLRQLCADASALPVVPPATMQLLMSYEYPGNVRELENILERALVFGGEVLLPEHLPEHLRGEAVTSPESIETKPETRIIESDNLAFPLNLDAILADTERRYLELALVKTNGAKKKAAELLGLNFRSFRYRLQKFNIAQDGRED